MSNRRSSRSIRAGWCAACLVAAATVASGGRIAGSAGPQAAAPAAGATVRLNQIIENFEQGKPSFNNQHWRYIAMEHAPYDPNEVSRILADLKPQGAVRPPRTPVIRQPPDGDADYRWMVKQVLDIGVMGVIISHVENKAQAMNIVRSMRYPPQKGAKHPFPEGRRGWGPTGATRYWGLNNQEYTLRAADLWPLNPDGELVAIAMVETREGVKNIDEILSVPGLSAVLIGPSDLSMALGVGPNPAAPEVEAATEIVAKACVAKKMLCGTFESPDVNKRVAQGFRLFTGSAGNYTPAR
jgi:4-hydroxy-2-oxoheptanedioate aldolase